MVSLFSSFSTSWNYFSTVSKWWLLLLTRRMVNRIRNIWRTVKYYSKFDDLLFWIWHYFGKRWIKTNRSERIRSIWSLKCIDAQKSWFQNNWNNIWYQKTIIFDEYSWVNQLSTNMIYSLSRNQNNLRVQQPNWNVKMKPFIFLCESGFSFRFRMSLRECVGKFHFWHPKLSIWWRLSMKCETQLQ